MKTTVMIVDTYAVIREMLGIVLTQNGRYEVVAQASTGLEALKLLRAKKPSLVILDLTLPEMSGLELLRHLRKEEPDVRVIVFATQRDREITTEALREDPHGYVTKCDSLATFHEVLDGVTRGGRYYAPSVGELLDRRNAPRGSEWSTLTSRERLVLQMVAEGKTSKEVAKRLSVSPKTVGNYRASVMQKLHLRDVTALTRYAVRRGLVSVED